MSSGPTVITKARWHVFNAQNQVVGRLAGRIAGLLMGKHKPIYSPHLLCGDKVIVLNAKDIEFTGKKYTQKLYRWHTGRPGGLKTTTPKILAERKNRVEDILEKAVSGMLPKNKLRKKRMMNLFVYKGKEHPHDYNLSQEQRDFVDSLQEDPELVDLEIPELPEGTYTLEELMAVQKDIEQKRMTKADIKRFMETLPDNVPVKKEE